MIKQSKSTMFILIALVLSAVMPVQALPDRSKAIYGTSKLNERREAKKKKLQIKKFSGGALGIGGELTAGATAMAMSITGGTALIPITGAAILTCFGGVGMMLYQDIKNEQKNKALMKQCPVIKCFHEAANDLRSMRTTNYNDVTIILKVLDNCLAGFNNKKLSFNEKTSLLFFTKLCRFLEELDKETYTGEKKVYKALITYLNPTQAKAIRTKLLAIHSKVQKLVTNGTFTILSLKAKTGDNKITADDLKESFNDMLSNMRNFIEQFKLSKANHVYPIGAAIDNAIERITAKTTTNFNDIYKAINNLYQAINTSLETPIEDAEPINDFDINYLYNQLIALVEYTEQETFDTQDEEDSFFSRFKTTFKARLTADQKKQLQDALKEILSQTLGNKALRGEDATGSTIGEQLEKQLNEKIDGFTSTNKKTK